MDTKWSERAAFVSTTFVVHTDGDTVQAITPEGTKLKVRLYGNGAPEMTKGKIPGEPSGNDARSWPARPLPTQISPGAAFSSSHGQRT